MCFVSPVGQDSVAAEGAVMRRIERRMPMLEVMPFSAGTWLALDLGGMRVGFFLLGVPKELLLFLAGAF
jgi:hypothetical protein